MFRMDKPMLGNLTAFFLNSLFSVSVSYPFTSYTIYFFNLMLALKSRGKAHKSYGSKFLPLEYQKDGQVFPLAGHPVECALPNSALVSPKCTTQAQPSPGTEACLKKVSPGFPGSWNFLPHFVTCK